VRPQVADVQPAVIDHVRTCVAGSWAGTPAGDMATSMMALAAWKMDMVIEHMSQRSQMTMS
jgi:hypothetical protein